MPALPIVVTGIGASTGTWTGLTVANLASIDTAWAAALPGATYDADITDAPADYGTLTSLVVSLTWRLSANASRAKSVRVELVLAGNVIGFEQTTPTEAAGGANRTDTLTFNSAAIQALTKTEFDALRIRCTNQEGSGMADSSQLQHNQLIATLNYEVYIAPVTASFAGTVPVQALAAGLAFEENVAPDAPTNLQLVEAGQEFGVSFAGTAPLQALAATVGFEAAVDPTPDAPTNLQLVEGTVDPTPDAPSNLQLVAGEVDPTPDAPTNLQLVAPDGLSFAGTIPVQALAATITAAIPAPTFAYPIAGGDWISPWRIELGEPSTEPPPPAEGLVDFGDARLEAILGPQVIAPTNGGPEHEWLWLEENAVNQGTLLGNNFPANIEPPYPDDLVYLTGLSVVNGSTTVTGSGFTTRLTTGDYVQFQDTLGVQLRYYTVTVNSNTQITLSAPWGGQTQTGIYAAKWRSGYAGMEPQAANYYDLAKCLYIHHYRTGNTSLLTLARKVVDGFWHNVNISRGHQRGEGDVPDPRHANLESFMVRALELDAAGTPHTMWDWINSYCENHFWRWFGARNYTTSMSHYFGVRPGAYTLHFMVLFSQVAPDTWLNLNGTTETNGAVLKQTHLTRAVDVAYQHYCRLQWPRQTAMPRTVPPETVWRWYDGTFDWGSGEFEVLDISQPFQTALLVDALTHVHRAIENNPTYSTEAAAIALAIVTAADDLWDGMRKTDEISDVPGKFWKGSHYFWHGGINFIGGETDLTRFDPDRQRALYGTSPQDGDPNNVRGNRSELQDQAIAHAYAFHLTGDTKYRDRFEYLMDATWAPAGWPRSDGYHGLQDYAAQPKHFSQGHRSTPKALAFIKGAE